MCTARAGKAVEVVSSVPNGVVVFFDATDWRAARSPDRGGRDMIVIPSNVEHGCVALEAGSLIDTFAPRRDDFL